MRERNDFDPLLTLDDVAAHFGVSTRTVRREVDRGRLKSRRVGRQLRFRSSDVMQYEEDKTEDEWDKVGAQDELPTFFEAMRPHLRRNQRGPGFSVGVDYLAKKWQISEDEVKGALKECGLDIP